MLIGQIKFGVVRQTLDAFAEVEGALNFIVNYYTYLADYAPCWIVSPPSTPPRSAPTSLCRGPRRNRPRSGYRAGPRADAAGWAAHRRRQGIRLAKGESVLLSGPSGSGKSTLFRAIAGIWPYFEGAIGTPKGAS